MSVAYLTGSVDVRAEMQSASLAVNAGEVGLVGLVGLVGTAVFTFAVLGSVMLEVSALFCSRSGRKI